jgi:hypothetical protein
MSVVNIGRAGKQRGVYASPVSARMAQRCPRCDAAPGHRCGRWSPDGFVWIPGKTFHKERRART